MSAFTRELLPTHVASPDPEIYLDENYVVLDFETTIQNKGSALTDGNSIVLAAWRECIRRPREAQDRVDYFQFGGEFDLARLVEAIGRTSFIVAHNAKFELQWLERCGVDLTNVVVWDTMIGDYVLGGNRYVLQQLSLKACAERWALGENKHDIISMMYGAGLCSTEIPESWLKSYCLQDVNLCHKIFLKQREAMVKDGHLLPVMYTRCLATPVLADVEKNGMQLDKDNVIRITETKEREYISLQNRLEEVTGGINLNSRAQLAEYLYETLSFAELTGRGGVPLRTPGGARKTDAATIGKLKVETDEQREFIDLHTELRELHNELSKYLRKFSDCCEEVGGHLRAAFNQCNTRTHRLSSSGMDYSTQFQNFPRIFKSLFCARNDGWLVGEVDGAQLEFRAAGHLGRDSVALGDISEGVDIHSITGGVIGCSRQDAKAHTFKPLKVAA